MAMTSSHRGNPGGRSVVPIRAVLLVTALAGLVVGVWAGLVRAGVAVPAGGVVDPATHGVVMVSGFFGALISLERAVALDRRWAYAAPPAAILGALGLSAGLPGAVWASLAAALIMTFGSIRLWRAQPSLFMAVMVAGAASWAIAVVLEIASVSIARQVPWLAAFLIGTIVGERLELSRLAPPSRRKMPFFVGAMTATGIGALTTSIGFAAGWRVFGAGLVLTAAWLFVFDVARRTIRAEGVTRFIAVCLLSGYAWLGGAGIWWLMRGDLTGELGWDGALHAVFLGFVFTMVFGHVFLVAPAVLGVTVPYHAWFGAHVVVLHLSLVLRLAGDLGADASLRRWGAIGNAVAIGLFLAATIVATSLHRRTHGGETVLPHAEVHEWRDGTHAAR